MELDKIDESYVAGCVRSTPQQLFRAIAKTDAREIIGQLGNEYLGVKQ